MREGDKTERHRRVDEGRNKVSILKISTPHLPIPSTDSNDEDGVEGETSRGGDEE